MHPREVARRTAEANERITAAATAIGEKIGVEAPEFGSVSRRFGPDVQRLREREMQAEHLEAIADALNARPKGKRGQSPKAHEQTDELASHSGAKGDASLSADPQSPVPGTVESRPDGADPGTQLPPPAVESEA